MCHGDPTAYVWPSVTPYSPRPEAAETFPAPAVETPALSIVDQANKALAEALVRLTDLGTPDMQAERMVGRVGVAWRPER